MRRKHLVVWFSLMAVVSAAGAAWACTSQPRLLMVAPIRSPKAEPVNISGEGIAAEQATTIRWNTLNGPKLAEVTPSRDGSFSTSIVIPDVAPGIYFILVESAQGVGRSAFEVTAPSPQSSSVVSPSAPHTVQTDLWQGFGSANEVVPPDPSKQSATSQRASDAMKTGASLATAGLVGLAAFGTVAVRRRRPHSAGAE